MFDDAVRAPANQSGALCRHDVYRHRTIQQVRQIKSEDSPFLHSWSLGQSFFSNKQPGDTKNRNTDVNERHEIRSRLKTHHIHKDSGAEGQKERIGVK